VAGVTIHWAEIGKKTKATPLVLLHGLQDCHLTWRRVVPALARDRQVLMLDLPGHGLSERPDVAYDLPWYARVTAAWLESLELDKADVVGHSLGGGVAQMMLLECSERIRRLVLAAPGGLGREITALLRLASFPLAVEHFGQPFLGIGMRLALRGVFLPEDLAALIAMNARTGSARAFARTVRDLVDWRGQRRRFYERAWEIDTLPPIALIWGKRDRVIPVRHAEAMAAQVDGVQVTVLEGCGHSLHHEQPERFARVVREFLDAPVVPAARLRATNGPGGEDSHGRASQVLRRETSPARQGE
jgi:pimeloyl-ACP methyl ester carboxylesterase